MVDSNSSIIINNFEDLIKLIENVDEKNYPIEIYQFILQNQDLNYSNVNNLPPELIFLIWVRNIDRRSSVFDDENDNLLFNGATRLEIIEEINTNESRNKISLTDYKTKFDEFFNNDDIPTDAYYKEVDIIRYPDNEIPGADATRVAAEHGYLKSLYLMHQMGYQWSYLTTAFAAANNQLECLIFAHENECPWDNETLNSAIKANSLSCFTYAIENGCLCNDNTNYDDMQFEILEYAYHHGCLDDDYYIYLSDILNNI